MFRFEQQVAIVTGAANGIGAATARRFGQEGASVVVADKDLAGAKATVAAIEEAGGKAIAVAVDVAERCPGRSDARRRPRRPMTMWMSSPTSPASPTMSRFSRSPTNGGIVSLAIISPVSFIARKLWRGTW